MIINDKKPIYKAYFGDTQIITNVGSEGTGGGGTTNTIDVATSGIKFSYSTFSEIPDYFDFSNVTDMFRMFSYCTLLQSIPSLDTSKVTTMKYMFGGCSSLTTIPSLDTSKVTTMEYMFSGCSSLTTIPAIDTGRVTKMSYMFEKCSNLTTIPLLDTSKVTDVNYMFYHCTKLESLPLLDCSSVKSMGTFFGSTNITTLTELGGFKNLKINWNNTYGLYSLPNLSYESVMNVINNLYDFRGNGDTTTTRTIKFNANSKALLSDADIAIATAKGWAIS